MSVENNEPLKQKEDRSNKNKKKKIKEPKMEALENQTLEELSATTSSASELVDKKKLKKKKINKEGSQKPAGKSDPSPKKKKDKEMKKSQTGGKELKEDNSVFSVTEKLLQKKKEQKEKKLENGLVKKKANKKDNETKQEVKSKKFFKKLDGEKGKAKPKWFEVKLKKPIATYLAIVELCNTDPTDENKLKKSSNEKRLYKFFVKLSKHLGEDIDVIRHWFHTTTQHVSKSLSTKKEDDSKIGTIKTSLLNKKLKSIIKETSAVSETHVVKSDKSAPVWFDEKFAELIKIRNKARRQFKLNSTQENKEAYQVALKKVKSEKKSRKKTGFVNLNTSSSKNDKLKPAMSFNKGKKFGQKPNEKSFQKPGSKFGQSKPYEDRRGGFKMSKTKLPGSFTPNGRSPKSFNPSNPSAFQNTFKPTNTPNKHIKFD